MKKKVIVLFFIGLIILTCVSIDFSNKNPEFSSDDLIEQFVVKGKGDGGRATNEATKTGLKSRMKRLPGEMLMYDPDTGVVFNPYNGKIENFKTEYARLPGEPLYFKKNANLKSFKVSIYAQFIPKKVNLSNKGKAKGTVYINGKSSRSMVVPA